MNLMKTEDNFVLKRMEKIRHFLSDDDITEIMFNPDGFIWIEDYKSKYKTDIHIKESEAKLIIKSVASENNKEMSEGTNSIVSGILVTGDRFEGISGSESKNKTIFCIRKKARKIYTLDNYIEQNIITKNEKDYIIEKIQERKNILIIGGTASGKTTFINACLNEFRESGERFIILEDTDEIQCSAPDTIKLEPSQITKFNALSESSMRLRPDIMIVGEMRSGDEVLSLLEMWNTGHSGGMSTVHANDCMGGIRRLQQLLMNYNKILPLHSAPFIANSIDILINIQKRNGQRKITEIAVLKGFDYMSNEFTLNYVKRGD